MLKQLILENWKSFRYAELPLDPLTVLIGTNASGKSNVVEALEVLQIAFTREDIKPALVGDSILPSIRGGVEWAAFKPEKKFTLKVVFLGQYINTDYIYAITVKTKPFLQVLEESIIYQESQNNSEENIIIRDSVKALYLEENTKTIHNYNDEYILRGNFLPTQTYLTNIMFVEGNFNSHEMQEKNIDDFYHYIKSIFILNPIPSKMRSYSPISEKLETDASNIAGVLAALSKKQKAEVEAALSNYIKELPEGDIQKVWAQKVGRFRTDAMLYCQEEWKPGHITEIDAKSMSDGTLRFLAILTALLTRPEGSQLVIEEIDKSTTLVLPLAAVIETGNHIAQAKTANSESKRIAAHKFAEIITYAADETTPWAKFREQIVLWEEEQLKELAAKFPNQAIEKTSMGDASIVILGWHYHQKGFHVEFLTDDDKLKSQEPPPPQPPTRRSSRTKR